MSYVLQVLLEWDNQFTNWDPPPKVMMPRPSISSIALFQLADDQCWHQTTCLLTLALAAAPLGTVQGPENCFWQFCAMSSTRVDPLNQMELMEEFIHQILADSMGLVYLQLTMLSNMISVIFFHWQLSLAFLLLLSIFTTPLPWRVEDSRSQNVMFPNCWELWINKSTVLSQWHKDSLFWGLLFPRKAS